MSGAPPAPAVPWECPARSRAGASGAVAHRPVRAGLSLFRQGGAGHGCGGDWRSRWRYCQQDRRRVPCADCVTALTLFPSTVGDLVMRDILLVLLGHENDQSGTLSPDALSRISTAQAFIAQRNESAATDIVVTGGFGEHFNRSNRAHGRIVMDYLKTVDIGHARITGFTSSNGTIQDALAVWKLVIDADPKPRRIVLVTSAYHAPRCELLFSRLFPEYDITTVTDSIDGTPEQVRHERRALRRARREMPVLSAALRTDSAAIETLMGELRHYDNLSYLPLSASFLVPYVWLTLSDGIARPMAGFFIIVPFIISMMFASMYFRLAGTAASARRISQHLGFAFDLPHLGLGQNLSARWTLPLRGSAITALALAWFGAALMHFSAS